MDPDPGVSFVKNRIQKLIREARNIKRFLNDFLFFYSPHFFLLVSKYS